MITIFVSKFNGEVLSYTYLESSLPPNELYELIKVIVIKEGYKMTDRFHFTHIDDSSVIEICAGSFLGTENFIFLDYHCYSPWLCEFWEYLVEKSLNREDYYEYALRYNSDFSNKLYFSFQEVDECDG